MDPVKAVANPSAPLTFEQVGAANRAKYGATAGDITNQMRASGQMPLSPQFSGTLVSSQTVPNVGSAEPTSTVNVYKTPTGGYVQQIQTGSNLNYTTGTGAYGSSAAGAVMYQPTQIKYLSSPNVQSTSVTNSSPISSSLLTPYTQSQLYKDIGPNPTSMSYMPKTFPSSLPQPIQNLINTNQNLLNAGGGPVTKISPYAEQPATALERLNIELSRGGFGITIPTAKQAYSFFFRSDQPPYQQVSPITPGSALTDIFRTTGNVLNVLPTEAESLTKTYVNPVFSYLPQTLNHLLTP